MAAKGRRPVIGNAVRTTHRGEILANDQGNRASTSYVALTDTERLIGGGASMKYPTDSFSDAKNMVHDEEHQDYFLPAVGHGVGLRFRRLINKPPFSIVDYY